MYQNQLCLTFTKRLVTGVFAVLFLPRHLDRGGGGGSPKNIFSALRVSVWSKNKRGGGRAPPLDPSLLVKATFIPYRKAFRADMKNCPRYSMSSNGTELEQVVHTHRTWCRSGWPREFGELSPSPLF